MIFKVTDTGASQAFRQMVRWRSWCCETWRFKLKSSGAVCSQISAESRSLLTVCYRIKVQWYSLILLAVNPLKRPEPTVNPSYREVWPGKTKYFKCHKAPLLIPQVIMNTHKLKILPSTQTNVTQKIIKNIQCLDVSGTDTRYINVWLLKLFIFSRNQWTWSLIMRLYKEQHCCFDSCLFIGFRIILNILNCFDMSRLRSVEELQLQSVLNVSELRWARSLSLTATVQEISTTPHYLPKLE